MVKDVFAWVLIYCNHGKFSLRNEFHSFFFQIKIVAWGRARQGTPEQTTSLLQG